MKRCLKILLWLIILPATMAMRCQIQNQNPSLLFLSGEMPRPLREAANPMPLSSESWGRLDVAVIDNGVDYTHPIFRNHVSVETNRRGEVVGVGRDFVGGDDFAHPVLINADTFAFGAKIVKGKIDAPLDDPLGRLEELNNIFMERLERAIASEESLKGTLFHRISKENMTILGAYVMVKSKFFSQDRYETFQEIGNSFDESSPAPEVTDYYSYTSYVRNVKLPWTMSPEVGLPYFGLGTHYFENDFHTFTGAPEFIRLLSGVYEQFNQEYQFDIMVTPYIEFHRTFKDRREGFRSLGRWQDSDIVFNLQTAFYKYKQGYDQGKFLFVQSSAGDFCSILSESQLLSLQDNSKPLEQRFAEIDDIVREHLASLKEVDEALLSSEVAVEEKRAIRKRLKNYDMLYAQVRASISNLGDEAFLCGNLDIFRNYNKETSSYLNKFRGPYRDGANQPSHGTHSAGVIIQQEPDVNILPVRVAVGLTEINEYDRNRLTIRAQKRFFMWLQNPSILNGVVALINENFKGHITESLDAKEQHRKVVELLSKPMAEHIRKHVERYQFAEDITNAIAYVGSKRIKLANISLTSSFEAPVTNVEDQAVDITALYEYLSFEFFKFSVAEAIDKEAKYTLFVLASGDSGNWVDGESRSSLPCDLSLPYFKKFREPGYEFPNEKLNQVLCVGSKNSAGDLSHFTNLPLTVTPFVLANGEAVTSAVTSGECRGQSEAWMVENREWPNFLRLNLYGEQELQAAIEKVTGRDSDYYERSRNLYDSLFKYSAAAQCMQPTRIESMSDQGTGKASPLVTARLASIILEAMGEIDLSNSSAEKLYTREEVDPNLIIRKLINRSGRLGGQTVIRDTHIVN